MAKLSVNNQVFNYKGTEYNIANIAKVEISTRQVKTTSSRPPFKPILYYLMLTILVGGASIGLSFLSGNMLFLFGILLALWFLRAAKMAWGRWWAYLPNGGTMHMLIITLNWGKKETFESSNGSTIAKIKSAISDAINKKSDVSFSMSGVNISISDSPNTQIGVFD